MEFLDEDARPRFLLQSKPTTTTATTASATSSVHKPTLFLCLPLSILFLSLSFITFTSDPLQSLLIWLSLSLLVGPFAPSSFTAGDISVGRGPPINPPRVLDDDSDGTTSTRKFGRRSRSAAKIDSLGADGGFEEKRGNGHGLDLRKDEGVGRKGVVEEGKWGDGDVEMLKKLMGKHPVGKPGRWEAVAEGFKGRYKVESVIKKSKELGEKKTGDEDSFKKFLKDRKPVDRRVENENGDGDEAGDGELKGESGVVWSSGEDLALLNALKTFPKDVAMRWEKIAAAVPGKTKTGCVKRVAVLKKDFRSSKAVPGEN